MKLARILHIEIYSEILCVFDLQISLVAPHDRLDMQLPSNTKAVRDLRFSPRDRLLLVASLGKKLSIIRFACACFKIFF